MTRVIAGIARGRRLEVPTGRDTRPTSDRAREALFASVLSLVGSLGGARVADLFAGSGAVGLEALSRGAAHALLVESHPRAVRVLRANVAAVRLPGAEVSAQPVERALRNRPAEPYDMVFADPPYALPDAAVLDVLRALRDNGWLRPDALVVVERSSRGNTLDWPDGYIGERTRRYGEAVFFYGFCAGPHGAGRDGPGDRPG